MKIRTVLITAGILAALGTGGWFGASRLIESGRKSVEVYPVSSVNMSYYGEEASTISGTILSRNTQSVKLNSDYTLKKVYVKAGDTVKIGDPLLEYDMTLEELKREMEDLHHQTLELTLEQQERDLNKLMTNPGAYYANASLEEEDDELTGSADILEDDLLMEEEAAGVTNSGENAAEASVPQELSGGETALSSDQEEMLSAGEGDILIDDLTIDDGSSGYSVDEEEMTSSGDDLSIDVPTIEEPAEVSQTELPGGTDVISGSVIADEVNRESETEGSTEPVTDQTYAFEEETDAPLTDPDALTDTPLTAEALMTDISRFLTMEELIRSYYAEDPKTVDEDDILDALSLFRDKLAEEPSAEDHSIVTYAADVFGNRREIGLYMLSQETLSLLEAMGPLLEEEGMTSSDMAVSLYRAYTNLCFYELVCRMEHLEELMNGKAPAQLDRAAVLSMEQAIRGAVDSWYRFTSEWSTASEVLQWPQYGVTEDVIRILDAHYKKTLSEYAGEDLNLGDASKGTLSALVGALKKALQGEGNGSGEETESIFETGDTEFLTEADGGDVYEDDGYYGEEEDASITQEELAEQIREQKSLIRETQLQIRESDLKLKSADRKLAGKVIRASMNGVVKTAGTVDEGSADEGFIVISGAAGMYAEGTVNELALDTIKIGDLVTGTSYENGATFTAKVTEISVYPTDGEDDYYGYGTENTNASRYPFLAYIEDADDVTEGSVELQFVNEESSSGIYLENYYIRTDDNGKSYVFIQGPDGLLKKQYVKTGASVYGAGWEVLSGLRPDDRIAFPYGKHVYEGAKTIEVDNPYGETYF